MVNFSYDVQLQSMLSTLMQTLYLPQLAQHWKSLHVNVSKCFKELKSRKLSHLMYTDGSVKTVKENIQRRRVLKLPVYQNTSNMFSIQL